MKHASANEVGADTRHCDAILPHGPQLVLQGFTQHPGTGLRSTIAGSTSEGKLTQDGHNIHNVAIVILQHPRQEGLCGLHREQQDMAHCCMLWQLVTLNSTNIFNATELHVS